MVLALRPRQRAAVIDMLNLTRSSSSVPKIGLGSSAEDADEANTYKLLVLDRFTHDVIAPLVTVKDLREHGVTLHLRLEQDREEIPDVPAIYFVRPTPENVASISKDFKKSLYDAYHLNFASALPASALEELALATSRWKTTCSISPWKRVTVCCTILGWLRRMSSD
jgi:hypothetical protein